MHMSSVSSFRTQVPATLVTQMRSMSSGSCATTLRAPANQQLPRAPWQTSSGLAACAGVCRRLFGAVFTM